MEEKVFTSELKKVLAVMTKDMLDDYPTNKIGVEYFMLSTLLVKNTNVNKFLSKYIEQTNIQKVYNYFEDKIKIKKDDTKVLNRKDIGYDQTLSKCIINSKTEKIKLNDSNIGTEHVLLSILNNLKSQPVFFSDIGFTYEKLFNEINIQKQEYSNKHEILDKTIVNNNYEEAFVNKTPTKPEKNGKKSMIELYCTNLNHLANMGKIDKLIGRELEVKRLIKVLGRRNKNNVIFCGLGGSGVSAIVKGIANIIEEGNATFLNGKTVYLLNVTGLLAGSVYRGMVEERLNGLFNELKNIKDTILFIDDIHTIIGKDNNNSSDISGVLSNALSNGDVQIVATTTYKGFKNSIENDPTLNRRFQRINIEPTNIQQTKEILNNSKQYYEEYHGVTYTNEAIDACVTLANKYITGRQLPDSAIDVMDECGSEKKINNTKTNSIINEIKDLKSEIDINNMLINKAMLENNFDMKDHYVLISKGLASEISDLEKKMKTGKVDRVIINDHDIYQTVSEIVGVPITKLSTNEKEQYLNIENKLKEKVIGQDEAIKVVAQSVKRSRLGLGRGDRPSAVIFLSGPSGTGKTLLAKTLANEIYGNVKSLIRFDMSEYGDKTSVNKLIGSSSGYIGYEAGGLLTEAIKNNPYCVLLLDEIEKAHKEVYNVFLQGFDEGYIVDNQGYKVSLKNTIIIMTSNIGAKDAAELGKGIGFNTNVEENTRNIVSKALKSHFPIEFVNRIDAIVHFNSLKTADLKQIIELELNNFKKRLNEIDFDYKTNDGSSIVDFIYNIINKDSQTGARKINRAIQDNIENIIVDLYLENDYQKGYCFDIKIENDKLDIK